MKILHRSSNKKWVRSWWEVGCTGKVRYENYESAKAERDRLMDALRRKFTVYRCQNCKKFHVGSEYQ